MKNKNKLKLVLDAVAVIVMLFLYKKNSISLMFHEVAGLAAIVIMLVHLVVNFVWVKGISAKFFTKQVPMRTRICYIINALMIADLLVLAISSVLISKKLFKINANPIWIRIHFCTAQVMLTLMGLHLGLHFKYIKNTLKIGRPVSFVLVGVLSAIALFGIVSIFQSSYIAQISAPFRSAEDSHRIEQHGELKEPGAGRGEGKRMGRGAGKGEGAPMHIAPTFSAVSLLKTVGQSASIMIFFAVVSFALDELLRRRTSKRKQ